MQAPYGPRQKVFWFSVTTRALVILLQFVFNSLCPDHDADAFRSPRDPLEKISIYDNIVETFIGGLTRWDAQYFVHIAKYGYTYENVLAFFPMFPLTVRCVGVIGKKLLFMLNEHSVIALTAVLINYFCFVKSAVIFYDLSKRVLGQTNLAYKAAILYCINPASIFFTAAYSESMFAYLTFYSMLKSLENYRFVYIPIGISALVRSNGLINIGFPIFMWLQNWYIFILPKIIERFKCQSKIKASVFALVRTLYSTLGLLNTIFLSLIPFIFFQIFIYLSFCTEYYKEVFVPSHVTKFAVENDLVVPGSENLTWCQGSLPVAYSRVQEKYWNVGFMKYYEFKQIPNFILASPILYIHLRCIFQYFQDHRKNVFSLLNLEGKKITAEKNKLPIELFVFIVHGLFLTLSVIFFVHIQVSTRFLASASPLLYWYCASLLSRKRKITDKFSEEYEERENLYSRWRIFLFSQKQYSKFDKCILSYFLVYLILGCFLHSNFLPWT